jgi:hypothetical protein
MAVVINELEVVPARPTAEQPPSPPAAEDRAGERNPKEQLERALEERWARAARLMAT